MTRKKIIFIITSLMIIVLGSSVYYIFYPTRNQISHTEESELKSDLDRGVDISDWLTFRNGEYGFEIEYPPMNWKLSGPTHHFSLCKQPESEEVKEEFCAFGTVYLILSACFGHGWEAIMNSIYDCSLEQILFMKFEKEIVADSGIGGYEGRGRVMTGEIRGVFFPLPTESEDALTQSVFFLGYLLDAEYETQDLEIFDKVISTFKFIEE